MNNRRVIKNPVLPGEMLSEEFLKPLKLTQKAFADHIGVDIKTVNRLIKGHTAVTPELAVKFASAFSMSAEFWLNLQHAVDIWKVHQHSKRLPNPLIKAS
jgi:addiction module HigA family antidote